MFGNLLALAGVALALGCTSCGRNEPPAAPPDSLNKKFAPSISPPEEHFYPPATTEPATQPVGMADRAGRTMESAADAARRTTSEARARMDRLMGTTVPATLPNNTMINMRERYATATPMDQSEAPADIAISAAIRRDVVMDDKLSNWDDKNCKIMTNNGVVTLRGPVSTAEARQEIEDKARATPGVTEVCNLLEVKVIEVTMPPAATNPSNVNP